MEILVDTGATNSIIHRSSLKKISHGEIYPVQEKFFLANKSFISIVGYVQLEIRIQYIRTYATAAITETLCCDVILGEDWIKQYQVTVNRFKNRIEILGNKAAMPLRVKSNKPLFSIRTQSAISIPPHTKQVIEAVTPISQATSAMFSPDLSLQEREKLLFTQTIIQIRRNYTKITLINRNNYPIYLARNTNLGMISLLEHDNRLENSTESDDREGNDDDQIIDQVSPMRSDETMATEDEEELDRNYDDDDCLVDEQREGIWPCINTIDNSAQVMIDGASGVEEVLQEAVQHIKEPHERLRARKMIGKYAKVFDTSSPTIAITSIRHTIPTGDHPPVNSVPYRGSIEQQQALKKMIDQLEKSKQIRPSSSPWSAPVLLIKKKDGNYRFVVDYRKLNAITTRDSFPIPTIELTLQQLAGNSYFSKLDLRSGYFQLPISEVDKPKTAFITTTGLWEFNVLPMGLTNAPPCFQRVMYNLVVNGREHFCLVYLDDIIVFSKTLEDHLKHLDEILSILDRHKFQLNPNKCSIIKQQIDYLGHSINQLGITPLYDNIKAIRELPMPDHPTLKQANEFIGGLGFYRKFVKGFAKIAAPLHQVTNLTRDKRDKFRWGDEQRQAVHQLKRIITGPDLVLEFPDPNLPYVLSTDASKAGLGAVLKQVTNEGRIKVVYYLSRVLSSTESRYSTTELEALAIVWSITKLRPYLLGRDFKIETDHCPLCQFHKKRSRNGRLDRWAIEILSEYNITEIKYKKGKCHCDDDLLSRYPLYTNSNSSDAITIRKQDEGYVFPHIDELEVNEINPEPTATINVITRSTTRKNFHNSQINQPRQELQRVNIDSSTTTNLALDDGTLPLNQVKVHNTRQRTRQLQGKTLSSVVNVDTKSLPSSLLSNTDTPVGNSSLTNEAIDFIPSTEDISLRFLQSYGDFSMKQIKSEQQKDIELQGKMKNLVCNQDYEMIDGIMYKLVPRGRRRMRLLWMPRSMINQVLFLNHDHPSAAHLGINKTTAKLVNKYYWPRMYKSIANYVRSCMRCSKYNYRRTKAPGKMNMTATPNEVMGLVGMDYWGPTDQPTINGNRYVITMTDYLSKFVFAKAVRTNSAEEAAGFFLDVCYRFGAPTKLITDQGSHFISELTRAVLNSCNTTHVLTTPYHHQSNAQTERFNATFAPALSKLMNDQRRDWDELLQPVVYAYNTSEHRSTKFSPFHLMFGRENALLMDPKQMKTSLSRPNQYYERIKRSRRIILDYAKSNIDHRNAIAKGRYDQNRPDPQYKVMDLVLIRVVNKSSKLGEKYEGPYRIVAQKGPSTFVVRIEDPDGDRNPNYIKQVTTSDMKLVFVREY